MIQKTHPCLPGSLPRVYGVGRKAENLRLPRNHPCHGCIHCNLEGNVPFCGFSTCKRSEYEALQTKHKEARQWLKPSFTET